jgi:predicted N-acetyltransferase YhbS
VSSISPAARELAENLNLNLPSGPRSEKIVCDRYALCLGGRDHPAFTVVQRLRLAGEDVAATLEEVRGLLRERDRSAASWEVGSSATPDGLVAQLKALGLRDDHDPHVVGMVLADAPAWDVPEVSVRRVETAAEQAAASRIFDDAFATPEHPAPELSDAERLEQAERELGEAGEHRLTFVAELDDEIVAAATAVSTPAALVLGAAATREPFRGRGAYRALVAARFDEARRRGAGALVVQAGPMSRPILQRLGFDEVAQIHILVDDHIGS